MVDRPALLEDATVPLRTGKNDDYARVIAALNVAEFSERAVWQTLRQLGLEALGPQNYNVEHESSASEAPSVFIRLFVELADVPQRQVESALDPVTLNSFVTLDLLHLSAGQYRSPVFLYPVAGFMIASDRYDGRPGLPLFEKSVYPAIESHSLRLLDLLPRRHVSTALDLGTGSGIYALDLSRHADRVVAVDINQRAVHFARFNSRLNGRSENVEIVIGDLYDELDDQTFDLISTFPPSTPSTQGIETWRDGGPSGEDILRRIVEGLPCHLRPGGRFMGRFLAFDTAQASFPERVRRWLGKTQQEFDVIVAVEATLSPSDMQQRIQQYGISLGTGHWEKAFAGGNVRQVILGMLAVERHGKPGSTPLTLRTQFGEQSDRNSFDFAFKWSRYCSTPEFLHALPYLKPRLSPRVRTEGHCVLAIEYPFVHRIKSDPAAVSLLSSLDGRSAVKEIFEEAFLLGRLPNAITLEQFLSFVAILISRGFMELAN